MGIFYASREAVKAALDVKATARNDAQIDRAIESASRTVEKLLHRRFYPEQATRKFDWPNGSYARSWRLWLDDNELITLDELASGSVVFGPSEYFLRRADSKDEPPYDSIELSLDGNAAFGQGTTWQRDVSVTGLFGYDDVVMPAGALAEALDTTETGVDVTDSSIGVGDLITVDTERMVVTGKTMLTTGQTLQADLTANAAGVSVSVTNGAAYTVGEVILLDSERMLIVDVAGNTLTVKRAWDGTVLATHSGSTIYAPRTLTVTRGALGTTAATHSSSAGVSRQVYPGPVVALCVAESLSTVQNELAGYAHTSGSDNNSTTLSMSALQSARDLAMQTYGRRARVRAV